MNMLPVNNSKTYFTGSKWKTNQGHTIKIIGRSSHKYISKDACRFPFYYVEFPDGYIVEVHSSNILRGKIKTPNHPSIQNIGFLGEGKYCLPVYKDEYYLWCGMLQRCYSMLFHIKNPSYKLCTVDKRWHNFQNFCNDLPFIEGYNLWKENTIKCAYAFDKDIKISNNKVYSKDTCIFVTISENSKAVNHVSGKMYVASNIKTGKEIIFENIDNFSKIHNLVPSCVGRTIRGDQNRRQHKGWKFKEII